VFREVEAPHALLHQTAQSIHAALQAGNRDDAIRQATEILRIEQEVLSRLEEMSALAATRQHERRNQLLGAALTLTS
jgi:hypothetical protein